MNLTANIIRHLHYHKIIMKRAYSCMVVDDPYESNNDPVFSEDSISSFSNDSDVDDLGCTDNTLRLKKILSLYRHICRMPEHAHQAFRARTQTFTFLTEE